MRKIVRLTPDEVLRRLSIYRIPSVQRSIFLNTTGKELL